MLEPHVGQGIEGGHTGARQQQQDRPMLPMVDQSRFKAEKAGPQTSREAMAQRQKARAMGGISALTARARMKFPAQNNTARVSNRYGVVVRGFALVFGMAQA